MRNLKIKGSFTHKASLKFDETREMFTSVLD